MLESGIFIAASFIYVSLMYILPPEQAKFLKPVGKILKFIANTPGGLKIK